MGRIGGRRFPKYGAFDGAALLFSGAGVDVVSRTVLEEAPTTPYRSNASGPRCRPAGVITPPQGSDHGLIRAHPA